MITESDINFTMEFTREDMLNKSVKSGIKNVGTGIYLLWCRFQSERPLYIGWSRNLLSRLQQQAVYFDHDELSIIDSHEIGRIMRKYNICDCEYFLIRELDAVCNIKRENSSVAMCETGKKMSSFARSIGEEWDYFDDLFRTAVDASDFKKKYYNNKLLITAQQEQQT